MTSRSLPLLILLLAAAPAAAQQPARVQPPRALVQRLFADQAPDSDLKRNGLAQVPASITVERRDLNADGEAEWVVEGTRYCGTNCLRWIYRRLPDGRFTQVYEGGSAALEVLPARSRGWSSLLSRGHMSCCEEVRIVSEFDGQRYAWRNTEYRADSNTPAPKVVYHVSVTPPNAQGERRLVLDPMNAGGGLWISARHDVCAVDRRCGAPELALSSAALPAGRVCVGFRSESPEARPYRSAPGERWCGTTTAARLPNGTTARRLVLHPTPRDWTRMAGVYSLELTGPGMPAKLELDAAGAVMEFGTRLGELTRPR